MIQIEHHPTGERTKLTSPEGWSEKLTTPLLDEGSRRAIFPVQRLLHCEPKCHLPVHLARRGWCCEESDSWLSQVTEQAGIVDFTCG